MAMVRDRLCIMNTNNKNDNHALIDAVQNHCLKRGAKLTEIRRQVLEILLHSPDVVKAYDVLNELQKVRKNAAPPTVYRALEFFVEMGILHRAESLNGFVLCAEFNHHHISVITSCTRCGKTQEIVAEKPMQTLLKFCEKSGFLVSSEPVVLSGLCATCQKEKR